MQAWGGSGLHEKNAQTPLMTAINTASRDAASMLIQYGADPYKANAEGTTCYDMAWHNKAMRSWVAELGVGEGTGVSGTGRFHILTRHGRKPVAVADGRGLVEEVVIVVVVVVVVVA